MNFLHWEIDAGPDDAVEVTLDKQANVILMDDSNFANFERGQRYEYSGGLAKKSPITLTPPSSGHWHVVVNLGGAPGTVRASTRVLQHA
jgi:hypothetical protein